MKKSILLIPILALGACTTVVEKPATTSTTTRETTAVSRPATTSQTTTTHTSY